MTRITRRRLLQVGAVSFAGLSGCTSESSDGGGGTDGNDGDGGGGTDGNDGDGGTYGDGGDSTDGLGSGEQGIGVEKIVDGFTSPIGIEFVGNRMFIADQAGQIYSYELSSNSDPSLFLDISGRMVDVGGYSERGLLGIAFHPDFQENNKFYVRYSSPPLQGTPGDFSHTEVLSEFEAENLDKADSQSERVIMKIPQPQSNHNAGSVVFGPDGYLYVGVGDGGGGGDNGNGHVEDWYDANSGGNGQDVTENFLGSILRIDVDSKENGKQYAIPDDNPLVGKEGLDEHFAWGLRNPWRMSFTDGDLYAADVGQNAYEEIDIVEKGGNYGWNVKEASHCYSSKNCPGEAPGSEKLIDPVIEYPHNKNGERIGNAVIGGYLYKSNSVPALKEKYVFGDWSGSFNGNKNLIFVGEHSGDGLWGMKRLQVQNGGDLGKYLLSFGRDENGELYMGTTNNSGVGGKTGRVHKLVPAPKQ